VTRVRLVLGVIAAAVILAAGLPTAAADEHRVFAVAAQNNSGETGTVTLTAMGDKTRVDVAIVGAPEGAQPAHIHEGTCAKLDPKPKYGLTVVTDGYSTTVVDVPIAKLTAGGMVVNVHKSTTELPTYVACGDITAKKKM
jgi:hypothetical protein